MKEQTLIEALKKIEQMSDPGSYKNAIIDMKQIASKALKEYSESNPMVGGKTAKETLQVMFNKYRYPNPLDGQNEIVVIEAMEEYRSTGMLDAGEAVNCLKALVELKLYKDTNGKNEFYTTHQMLAWERAFKIVNILPSPPVKTIK